MRTKAIRKYDDCFYQQSKFYYYYKLILKSVFKTDTPLLFEEETQELTLEEYIELFIKLNQNFEDTLI